LREEDRTAFDGLKIGDVLLGHEGTPTGPCGEMFFAGKWEKISFEPNATFLVVNVDEQDDERVYTELVILASGLKVEMFVYKAAIGDRITLLRGKRVLSAEECGTVGP